MRWNNLEVSISFKIWKLRTLLEIALKQDVVRKVTYSYECPVKVLTLNATIAYV